MKQLTLNFTFSVLKGWYGRMPIAGNSENHPAIDLFSRIHRFPPYNVGSCPGEFLPSGLFGKNSAYPIGGYGLKLLRPRDAPLFQNTIRKEDR